MADQSLRMLIEILIKGGNVPAETAAKLRQLAKEADDVTKKTGSLEAGLKKLSAQLVATLGAQQLISLVSQSLTQFARYERGLGAIGFQMRQLGIDAQRELPGVRAFLESLGAEKLQESIPAFQKFLTLTKDVGAAQSLVRIAVDASETGIMSLGSAADGLANILQGRAAAAAKEFGIQVRKANGETKTNAELLDEVKRQFEGYAASTSDTQESLDKLNAEWVTFKNAIGEGVARILSLVGGLGRVTDVFRSLGPIAVKTGFEIAGFFVGVGRAASEALDLKRIAVGGFDSYKNAIKAAFKSGFGPEGFGYEIEGARDELDRIWAKSGASNAEAEAAGYQKAKEIANRAAIDPNADKEAAERRKKAEEDRYNRKYDELKLQGDLLKQEEEYYRELGEKADEFNREKADRQAEIALTAEEELRKAIADGKAATLEGELGLIAEYSQRAYQIQRELEKLRSEEELADLKVEYERKLALLEGNLAAQARLRDAYEKAGQSIRARTSNAIAGIDRREADEKKRNQRAAQDAVMSSLGVIFQGSKKASAALAMIDAFAGAARALKDYPAPYSYIIAAATLGAGLARVHQILSVNVDSGSGGGGAAAPTSGRGFDDPVNDRAAYVGSQRWGRDATREILAGMSAGMMEGARDAGAGPGGMDATGGRRSALADTIAQVMARSAGAGSSGRLAAAMLPAGARGAAAGPAGASDAGPLELGRESTRQLVDGFREALRDELREAVDRRGDAGSGDTVVVAGLNYLKEEGLRQLNRDLERVRRRDSNRKVG
jgi:hypothetical protein